MSLRRLHPEQPDSFAFTPANAEWAKSQIAKYPEGRQASAVIPLLWRAQEQEGWVTRPAIETVASMLGMADIRVLEVATFYFMFQLQPVGSVAHIQVCGTTSCMICGAEDLIGVCKEKIAPNPHQISADGKFSWEEVECLGACANAPMAQIGKDYFEDLTAETFAAMIDRMAAGEVPTPGPQNGRWASEPADGLTSLHGETAHAANASIDIATQLGDSLKRIDGTDPVPTWNVGPRATDPRPDLPKTPQADTDPAAVAAGHNPMEREALEAGPSVAQEEEEAAQSLKPAAGDDVLADGPALLTEPREGKADNLKKLKGVGPKLESTLNGLGVFHFDQIASWTADEIAWVDERLKFKGRIERDGWIEQAKILAAGGETEFSKRK